MILTLLSFITKKFHKKSKKNIKNSMFSLSLCMIVKNEEDVLERILLQAKRFADEIIIVDTGSTDSTIEIAKRHTDKVFEFKWENDFSKARNFAFSLGSCDYLMWLDADDYITDANVEKIQKLKQSTKDIDIYLCKYNMDFDTDNHPHLTFNRERILKRERNFKWQGVVHEVIQPSGKIVNTDIEIEHRKLHATIKGRNLKIYENAIRNGVLLSPRELYYYSRELFYNGKLKKAATNLKRFLKIECTYPPDNLEAHIILSECLKDKNASLNILFEALKKHTPTGELCCKIAYLFEQLGKTQQAIFWFKSALQTDIPTQGFVREEYQKFIPAIELSRLLFQQNFEEAKSFHELAKSIHPRNETILFNDKFFSLNFNKNTKKSQN